MLYASGYALPKDQNVATQTITKHGGVTALGRVTIELLGGGGKDSGPDRTSGYGAGNGAASGINMKVQYWNTGLFTTWVKKLNLVN